SPYMNDRGPVPACRAAFDAGSVTVPDELIGWLEVSSKPWFHGTVTAEAVVPNPVIWSKPLSAARAGPGGPRATSVASAPAHVIAPAQRSRCTTATSVRRHR